MAQPYVGEIKTFAFTYAPRGWAICNGQILSIQQNQALFAILGTTYGGNGTTTFGLPDLRGRVPIHYGNSNYGVNYTIGQRAGEELHTLIISEMPSHNHTPSGNNGAPTVNTPIGNFWAQATNGYSTTANGVMATNALGNNGGNQGHENRSPYLTLLICIALQGIFPSRN